MSSTPEPAAPVEPILQQAVAATPPPPPPPLPPRDNLRLIRISLVILTVIAGVGAITYLGSILEPALIALFLYYAINPVAQAMIRRGVPPWITYVFLLAVAVVLAILLGRILYDNALQVQARLPRYEQRMDELLGRWSPANSKPVARLFEEATHSLIQSALGTTLGLVEAGVMVFFYLLFIVLNSRKIQRRIQRALSPQQADQVLLIGQKINEGMQQYVKTKTNVSLGLAFSSTLILYLFNVDYYLLWGFFFFALNYVTYVGSLAACVPPIALAFMEFSNPWIAALLSALLIVNRLFWIDYVEIKTSGQSLNLDPLLLLFSLAYWGWFWGLVGLVLAVPMLTTLKIVLANIEHTQHWAILMGEE